LIFSTRYWATKVILGFRIIVQTKEKYARVWELQ
jgi:hypothetical protein